MSSKSSFYKDRHRLTSYNIQCAQFESWKKALDVSKQLMDKTSKRKHVFCENFVDYIKSMYGEVKSVQKHQYKLCKHTPNKKVSESIEQFFNRIINLYMDTDISNDEIYALIRFEINDLHIYCLKMTKQYSI